MPEGEERQTPSAGERAQNIAVDTTGTVAKVTASVVGAAAIGVVKGLGKAVWRSVKRR